MKIETEKEIFFQKLNKEKAHKCEPNESFSKYLEESIEKNIDEVKEKQEVEEKTSVFAEKKIGKRRTDIFDTMIDL